jgi:hypothetical protein
MYDDSTLLYPDINDRIHMLISLAVENLPSQGGVNTAVYFACPVNQVGGSLGGDDGRSFQGSPITALSTPQMKRS